MCILVPSSSPDGIVRYIRSVFSIPLLENKEEKRLALEWKEKKCQESFRGLVLPYLRMVVKIAFYYKSYGVPISDLISEGNIGLIKAVKNYEPDKGSLATYAPQWIQSEIKSFIIHSWSVVRISSSRMNKMAFSNMSALKIEFDKSSSPSIENIPLSKKARVESIRMIDLKNSLSRFTKSDIAIVTDENTTYRNTIKHNQLPSIQTVQSIEDKIDSEKKMKILQEALTKLDEREKEIIKSRFFVHPKETLKQLGAKYKISCERVRQIERKALEKIKTYISNDV